MAHFRGLVQGARQAETRLGSKNSGLTVEAQSWQGKVVVRLYHENGEDRAHVSLAPHGGQGISHTLYDGPVSGAPYAGYRMGVAV